MLRKTVCSVELYRMSYCTADRLRQKSNRLPTESEYFASADKRIYLDLNGSIGYADELEKLRYYVTFNFRKTQNLFKSY